MINVNEALKKDFNELTPDEQNELYKTFLLYVVRKEIAEQNKQLTSIFNAISAEKSNSRVIANYFNYFNSCFVNCNLISCLTEREVNSNYLENLSNEGFNKLLQQTSSFNRQVALICFSLRDRERIPNRVDLKTMIAYANMQARTISNFKFHRMPIRDAIQEAAKTTRSEFRKKYGYNINDGKISETCNNYQNPGKKLSTLWTKMLNETLHNIRSLDNESALDFVVKKFTPTYYQNSILNQALNNVNFETDLKVQEQQDLMKKLSFVPTKSGQFAFSDSAIPADYDEVFTKSYRQEVYDDFYFNAITCNIRKQLTDLSQIINKDSSKKQ